MARKAAAKEVAEETPKQDVPEPVAVEEETPPAEVDGSKVPFDTPLQVEQYMEECLKGTMDEVARCDEYIQTKMDSYRRFQTYKEEIFMYRYKVHQLRFHPNYPHIRPCDFPERPVRISDQ